jgi:membrane associated rhomboid family serine protease
MIPLRDVIPSRTTPGVTITLIAANVAVYLFQLGLTERGADAFLFLFGLVPASFSIANLFTSMFVHGGFAHLAGNMLFLWIFGDNVEDRFGHARFLGFYLVCGVVAALSQVVLYPYSDVPMVGASGAIAGVMGAYLVLYPHSRVLMLFPFPPILFELPALFFLALWFAVQFLNGISSLPVFEQDAITGGVAFWAHVMGFVSGLVLVVFLRRPERQRVDWWDTIESQQEPRRN